ncbi:MAG: helix-turn-helix domain-containing protein [Bacteroidota bacterium]
MTITTIIAIITTFLLFLLSIVLLISKRGNKKRNRILASFMLFNGMLVSWFMFGNDIIKVEVAVPFSYFCLAPILFFYVRALCLPHKTEIDDISWHFLLPAIVFVYYILILIIRKEPDEPFSGITAWQQKEYLISQILLNIQIAFYILLIFRLIRHSRIMIREHFSSVQKIDLTWLLFIILTFMLMWLTDLTSFVLGETTNISDSVFEWLTILSLSINLVFATAIVYRGLQHPDIFGPMQEQEKYSGSSLTAEDNRYYARKLRIMMNETKPYLNPDLAIRELAENLGIHTKYLSQVINSQFNQNFFDFINGYRIVEAKRIMSSQTGNRKTILEILYEVGYNSKSAFNTSFKKATGMTPTQYRDTSLKLG